MSGLPDPATPPELTALEDALRDLLPRRASVDRDAVLFRAGQASCPRRWVWPCATAVATAATVFLVMLLVIRPGPQVIERIVHVPVPAVSKPERTQGADAPRSPSVEAGSPDAETTVPVYTSPKRRLEEHLLRWGLDGLGDPGPDPEPPARRGEPLSHSLSSLGE
jgi:hypothetical protein